MSELGDEKAPKAFWAAVIFYCVAISTILVFAPSAWIDKSLEKEHEWTQALMGAEAAATIQDYARGWYDSLFVETQVDKTVFEFFVPTAEQMARSKGFEQLGGLWFQFMADRAGALHKILVVLLERLAHIVLWLPFMAIVFVPSVIDGWMTWRVKRTNFDYASPFLNRHGHALTILAAMLVLVGIIVPVPVPPLVIPVLSIAIMPVIGIWVIGNLPKRI